MTHSGRLSLSLFHAEHIHLYFECLWFSLSKKSSYILLNLNTLICVTKVDQTMSIGLIFTCYIFLVMR